MGTSIISRGPLGVVVPSAYRQRVRWGGRAQLVAAAGNGWLILPPPAGARQMAHSWMAAFLAPAKFPPLGSEPKRPEFELAGCPSYELCSSPGSSFLICKTHRMQACPWQSPHLDSRRIFLIFRSEPLPFSHTLYGSPLSQGKYSAP